nr:hypothetical protein [Tanacetum cinerariifolium]
MHVANTSVEARCRALKAELANFHNKSHHDNQEELINHFSKFEVMATSVILISSDSSEDSMGTPAGR